MAGEISFLNLPRHLRAEVYSYAWLFRYCPIDFMQEGRRLNVQRLICLQYCIRPGHEFHSTSPTVSCAYEHRLLRHSNGEDNKVKRDHAAENEIVVCLCPALPLQLLRVSRFIHDEAEGLFYCHNFFRISPGEANIRKTNAFSRNTALSNSRPLQVANAQSSLLRSLSLTAIQGLTSLDINLGVIADAGDVARCTDICNFLSDNIDLPHFSLSLVAATTPDTATLVLEEISKLGRLKECSISLQDEHNDELAQQIRETVEQLTGISEPV
jgi:hypothetical protein